MGKGGKSYASVDEVIAYLGKSELPTLITEGSDDYYVFRRLEHEFSICGISVMPVGGRECLLRIFERRGEIKSNAIIGFIADRDLWVYSKIPDEFKHDSIIFTNGYSIENDLYADGNLEKYLDQVEAVAFSADLKALIDWFSRAVELVLAGHDAKIDKHPDSLVRDGRIKDEILAQMGELKVSEFLKSNIEKDYKRLLRGKTLLSLLTRYLSAPKRPAQFSKKALMEMGAVENGANMQEIRRRVGLILGVA